jgi:hypothetical protein
MVWFLMSAGAIVGSLLLGSGYVANLMVVTDCRRSRPSALRC